MKSAILFIALLLSAVFASAQLPVGSWLTGACIYFNYSTAGDGENKTTDFQLFPATFYTLDEHWGIGGGIYYDMTTTKAGDSKSTQTTFGIQPGVRYYGQISDRVNCYFQGNLNVAGGSTKYEFDGNESKTTDTYFGLNAHPGIMWNIKERTFIDFSYGSLSYLHTTVKDKDSDTKASDNSFGLNLNTWTLGVALYYTFGTTE